MKRLRLIKPWRLRAVHQRLGEASFHQDILVPCCGPVSSDDEVITPASCRQVFYNDGRAANRKHAPVSTVGFKPQHISIR